MEIIGQIILKSWELAVQMAPYILFGVVMAGILHVFVPVALIRRHLGGGTIAGVFKAALIGMPLPLCSCSVIPFTRSLTRQGASRGSVLSFLISTPVTGVDSILATYGVLGPLFMTIRIAASLVLGIAAGLIANILPGESKITTEGQDPEVAVPQSVREVFRYGFGVLFRDLAGPLAVGLLIGGAIMAAMPESFEAYLSNNRWVGYGVILAVAVPLYVCATASIPVAVALMTSGFSSGAALIFLMAGPATNTVTMSVVAGMLGRGALAVYIGVIVLGSLMFGVATDALLPVPGVPGGALHGPHDAASPLSVAAAALMTGLMAYNLVRRFTVPSKSVQPARKDDVAEEFTALMTPSRSSAEQ